MSAHTDFVSFGAVQKAIHISVVKFSLLQPSLTDMYQNIVFLSQLNSSNKTDITFLLLFKDKVLCDDTIKKSKLIFNEIIVLWSNSVIYYNVKLD